MSSRVRTVAILLPLLIAARAAVAAPRVVVTVKPLHSLIAGVMAGVGDPDLIIRGVGSPHTYTLKPSEARRLENAQVIFWVGEALETFMAKPLEALGGGARVVEVMRAPGVSLLPGRAGGAWDEHADPGREGHAPGGGSAASSAGEHSAGRWDAHLWLDPDNARAVVRLAAATLGEIDPANRRRYQDNAITLAARIDAADAELKDQLAPVRDVPFVVFHDAYQYFERRYALHAVGSITVGPDRPPGARRVREVREKIRSLGARCVFSEPQFPPAIVGTLIEGTNARTGTLDPEGATLAPGPEAYFALVRALGSSLAACLGP